MSDKLPILSSELSPAPSQAEYLRELAQPPEHYQSYLDTLPGDVRRRIQSQVIHYRHGLNGVAPLSCLGPQRCPFLEKCPIPAAVDQTGRPIPGPLSNYPMGRDCVLESLFLRQKQIEYIQHLDVDPQNPVEMAIVNELALIDLYKNRALMVLSVGDSKGEGRDFLKTNPIGVSESGVVAEMTQEHPVAGVIDKLERRRERWLDRLNETRKAKTEIALKLGESRAESQILQELTRLQRAIQQMQSGPIELEGEQLLLDD